MSPGTKGLLGEAASWVAGLVLLALAVVHHEELQAVVGHALGGIAAEQGAGEVQRRAGVRTARTRTEEMRPRASGTVEILAGAHGHFHTTAEINGRAIEVLVDTGASMVALPYEDAERAGIYLKDSDFTHRVSTANGTGRIAPVMLAKVTIGDITVRDVRAAVAEPGKLTTTLLGMTFLGRLSRTEMRAGVLVLQE